MAPCSFCHRVFAHVILFCVEIFHPFDKFEPIDLLNLNYFISFGKSFHTQLTRSSYPTIKLLVNMYLSVALTVLSVNFSSWLSILKSFYALHTGNKVICFAQFQVFTEVNEVKVVQSFLTLCDPMDYSVHGILQAIMLERVHFPISMGSSHPRNRTEASHIADRFFTS